MNQQNKDSTTWSDLADGAPDPATLRAGLDLARVAEALGIELHQEGERWTGMCPFHTESDPSFSVYRVEDGTQRAGCFGCGFDGDLFDLLKEVRGVKFSEAYDLALQMQRDGIPAPPPVEHRDDAIDLAAMAAVDHDRAMTSDGTLAVYSLLNDRRIDVPAEWLIKEFSIGAGESGSVVIPHYGPDGPGGPVHGIKWRAAWTGWDKRAVRGSHLDQLYGVWRTKGRKRVLVVEGESDTWTASWLLRDEKIDVVGLPSGVAKRPVAEWLDWLKGREVTLLFDADDAGRRGLRSWCRAMMDAGNPAKVALLPEGQDVSSTDPAVVLEAIERAESSMPNPPLVIFEDGLRYSKRVGEDGKSAPVSDFVLRLDKVVTMEDGRQVWRVRLPDGFAGYLTGDLLSDNRRLTRWCADHGYAWLGQGKDPVELLRFLQHEGLFVPHLKGTEVIGWHDGGFVLPEEAGGNLKADGWVYVPPPWAGPPTMDLGPGTEPWHKGAIAYLAELHRPEVMTPILGWMAAAALRSLLRKFPVLAVVGGSGWGKTTIIEETMRVFGYLGREAAANNLTSTTRYPIAMASASTNAIPVWWDEYRQGIRLDAKDAIHGAIQDSWDAAAASRGGVDESNAARIGRFPATAPLVVSGEDSLVETAKKERCVTIQIPRDGRNADALAALQSMMTTGLGQSYLLWLIEQIDEGHLPDPPMINDRKDHARAVARWGYELLDAFCQQLCGYSLPPFSDALVKESQDAEAVEATILRDALDEYPRDNDRYPLVAVDGHDLLVRNRKLYKWASEHSYPLPGGPEAFTKKLLQMWPGGSEQGERVWVDDLNTYPPRKSQVRVLRLKGAAAILDETEGQAA